MVPDSAELEKRIVWLLSANGDMTLNGLIEGMVFTVSPRRLSDALNSLEKAEAITLCGEWPSLTVKLITNRIGKWLCLSEQKTPGKTKKWEVFSANGGQALGVIKWWGAWRKYAFFPNTDTLFESDCLRAIADFTEAESKRYRATWAIKRLPCRASGSVPG